MYENKNSKKKNQTTINSRTIQYSNGKLGWITPDRHTSEFNSKKETKGDVHILNVKQLTTSQSSIILVITRNPLIGTKMKKTKCSLGETVAVKQNWDALQS